MGLLKKLQAAFEKDTLEDASKDMFDSLEKGSKAEMALELLYLTEPEPGRTAKLHRRWPQVA